MLKNIIFSLTILILFISFVEITLRIFKFPSVILYDEINALKKCWEETEEYHSNYAFNNLGLRGIKAIQPKKNGVYRIVCLGDSWTFGLNVPREKSYPVLIEEYLQKHKFKKSIEVINAGYPGWRVEEMRRFLLKNMKILSPDCIILLGGMNGVLAEERADPENEQYISFYSSSVGTLLAQSYFYNALYYLLDFIENAIESYSDNEKNSKEIALLQNMLNVLEKQDKKIIVLSYFFPKINREGPIYSHYQEEVDEENLGLFCMLQNPNFIFINLFEIFQNIEKCNDLFLEIYYVHPNEKGYKVLAKIIGEQFLEAK